MMFGLKGTLFFNPENSIVFSVDAVHVGLLEDTLVNQNNVGNINQLLNMEYLLMKEVFTNRI